MENYVNLTTPLKLVSYKEEAKGDQDVILTAVLEQSGQELEVSGRGNGLLDAFCQALRDHLDMPLEITQYHQHALESSSASKAITYLQMQNGSRQLYIGSGISSSVSRSSLRAVVSSVNQILQENSSS
jgi:2-isopropylmalate synthase